jgi:hypothetical protein
LPAVFEFCVLIFELWSRTAARSSSSLTVAVPRFITTIPPA